MAKKRNPDKARRHESKGDTHFEKGKFEKALKEYRKAQEFDPELPGIYEKLADSHDRSGADWEMSDFAESVSWTMARQAQENPPIKQVHAKLSPEWKDASELVFKILAVPEGTDTGQDIERLVGMGEIASRALIEVLLGLKRGAREAGDETGKEG